MYKPRPRQLKAIENICNFINSSKKNHGIFVYPTSFGKSILISHTASKFPDKYFINITTSVELLKQNYEKYVSYGYEATLCSASLKQNEVGRVTFATIGTLVKQLNFYKDKEVVILFDECHIASTVGSQLDSFLKKLSNYKLVGVTATPFRLSQGMEGTSLKMMNRDRKCIYKSIEDIVQIHEVVTEGYWSKLIYDIKDIEEESLVLNQSGTEYTDESLKKFNDDNDMYSRIIDEIKVLESEGRKSILVSVPFIEDALNLKQMYGDSEAIYSGMDSKYREEVVSAFKAQKIKVIFQVKILTVGFDFPELDALILAAPSNSLTFYYQFLGRLVRIHKNKTNGKIVDLSGNCKKFGKVETITIENLKCTKGWAVFNGENLLSNYPLNTTIRPTKSSLEDKIKRDAVWAEQKVEKPTVKFWFGKYKDKTVTQVIKENKSYLTWLIGNKDFKWEGNKRLTLKECIYDELGLTSRPTVITTSIKDRNISTQELLQEHTSKYGNLNSLKDIF